MSQPSDGAQIELHIFAPKQAADHVELLYAIAHYHRNSKPIGLGDSVNFGRPWAQGSQCDHGLISLPYLDGPLLENVVAPEGNTVIRFLWLLPITRRELAYKKQFGLEALEQRLEVEQVNYLDPMRQSVV